MKKVMIALVAALTFAVALAPQEASAQWRRGGGGGAVAAGIAAGVIGGALIGSAIAGPRYYGPAPVYAAPGPVYYAHPHPYGYVEEEEVVVQPRCFIKRQPLYDEYGRVVAFQNRRICR